MLYVDGTARGAAQVTYDTYFFLDKNKDFVVADHQNMLDSSSSEFVSAMFPKSTAESHSSMKFSSVGGNFKRQLGELMEVCAVRRTWRPDADARRAMCSRQGRGRGGASSHTPQEVFSLFTSLATTSDRRGRAMSKYDCFQAKDFVPRGGRTPFR